MKLTINKNSFVNTILTPVSKIADNLMLNFEVIDSSANDFLAKTLVSSSDNSLILLSKVKCKITDPFQCIVPDCKTFLRLFSSVEDENITLNIDSNVIDFRGSNFSFKYHLLDESYIVNKKSISEEKLSNLTFDSSFKLTKQKLSEIIKFNSIVPDAEKIYFYSDPKTCKTKAKIGDDQKANTNEITVEINTDCSGTPLIDSFPISIQNLLLFAFVDETVSVHVNHALKVFKFKGENTEYIISGLVK